MLTNQQEKSVTQLWNVLGDAGLVPLGSREATIKRNLLAIYNRTQAVYFDSTDYSCYGSILKSRRNADGYTDAQQESLDS